MNAPIALEEGFSGAVSGFEIERELGRGGMATVYLATQTSLHRKVALKVLRSLHDPDQRVRFLNESRIIASLNHRNIITIHDVGEHEGRVYLSMEHLDGGDLAQRLASGPIDPCTALEITAGIAEALAFAHEHHIVHRDIKPGNILFHRDGTPVLTDFGIATSAQHKNDLTAHDAAIGTPCYVSPEQVQAGGADARSDIYSLGVVLYEMLVGRAPFHEASAVETMAAHVNLPPPALPDSLSRAQPLLDRMIAKNPAERFPKAAEVVEVARNLQIDWEPVAVPRRPWHSVVEHQLRHNLRPAFEIPLVRWAAGVTAVVLCASIALQTLQDPDPVDVYLDEAQQAFRDDRLAYPLEGSAFYFYREVLMREPMNEDALDGLHEIAEVYADRAEEDLISSNFPSAKFHINRGLEVEPSNSRLKKLRRDTNHLRHIPEKIVGGIKSIFGPS